jgi:carbonic anhydrase
MVEALPSASEAAIKAEQGNQGSLFTDSTLGEEAAEKLEYTYSDTNWEKWPQCRAGTKQSPIDLQRPFFGAYLKLKNMYKDQLWPVQENDGRVMRVKFKEGDGSILGIGDKLFTPYEAVFHAPSEHKLQGKTFDMEMQIMHKDSVGNMVGLSVFMEGSDKVPKDNFYVHNVFSHFFQDLPKANNKRRVESLNLKWILNEEMTKHYITYHGSLSHPPCTEGVEWFILGRPWLLEKKWIKGFKSAIASPNTRPLQPVGKRLVHSF